MLPSSSDHFDLKDGVNGVPPKIFTYDVTALKISSKEDTICK
jgi:hypothetical protein